MLRTHRGVITFGEGNTLDISHVRLFANNKWTYALPLVYMDGKWVPCGTKWDYEGFITADQGQLVTASGTDYYVRI